MILPPNVCCNVSNPCSLRAMQGERKRHTWGVNLLVQSAFLFSSVLPFACEDVVVPRTCFSLCSAMIPEDGGWGSELARA